MQGQNKKTRNRILKIRVSDDEFSQMHERAPANSRGLSPWIRALALGEPVKKDRFPSVDPKLISSLARIGNNLNQIAHHSNSAAKAGSFNVEAAGLLRAVEDIQAQLDVIEREHTRC
jgi:DNA-binding HxlR family transcriptional regulator